MKDLTCVCGRVFSSTAALGGHHSHCITYLTNVGRLSIRSTVDATNGMKSGKKLHEAYIKKKEVEHLQWISEKHTCEKCGKVMTNKYGSGRFCSQSCANGRRHSAETKVKISSTIRKTRQVSKRSTLSFLKYQESPSRCVVCNKLLSYENRTRKTCSEECYKHTLSSNAHLVAIHNGGNINKHGVRGTAKYGFYKGIHCDSSWELAYVVYNLAHGVNVIRNTTGFPYTYNGREHLYFPDFIIDGVYVEIKNYWAPLVEIKMKQFPADKQYNILYFEDIKHCIKYCQEKFGKDFWKSLYDKDKPSCNS